LAPCSPLGVTSSLLVMDMSDMDKRYDWFSVLESSELELWVNILSSEVILAYEKAPPAMWSASTAVPELDAKS
jgi:hypothetical protein